MTILNDYGGMGAAEAMELGVLNHELLELDMALGCQWFSKHGGLMEYDRWINMDNHMYSIYHGYIYTYLDESWRPCCDASETDGWLGNCFWKILFQVGELL